MDPFRSVAWHAGKLRLIDQRRIPWELAYLDYTDYREVARAIQSMVVRGAPAIGAAAAFAMALAALECRTSDRVEFLHCLEAAAAVLRAARPTAVNLQWAVDRILRAATTEALEAVEDIRRGILAEAQRLADEDVAVNRRIGEQGAALIHTGDTVLHHCNTGALATVGWGTALGVIRTAHGQGKQVQALLTETRPRLQGARLSAWELQQAGIPFHVIADGAAGHFLRSGKVNLVMVGSDRTAANGDVANKIGTYPLAVLARENGVPFYAVMPTSTIDLNTPSGDGIPIEERDPDEIRSPHGLDLMPKDYPVQNPAFDVTPNRYVTGIVTEHGVAYPPFEVSLRKAVEGS